MRYPLRLNARWLRTAAFFSALCLGVGCRAQVETAPDEGRQPGTRMTISYTIRLADSGLDERDSQVDAGRLSFTIGEAEIFPALEAELTALSSGDRRSILLEAEDAYGPRDENEVRQVEISLVPEAARSVGSILLAEDDLGNRREAAILSIDEETAVIDMNHPLAGRSLTFDVEVIRIEPPKSQR